MSLPICGSLWEMTGKADVTTLIGAGGKTTSSHVLAQEISLTKPVVMTTTTKVYPISQMLLWESKVEAPPWTDNSYFWYAQKDLKTGKWIGPDVKVVDSTIALEQEQPRDEAKAEAGLKRCWVIEGDGARGLKLKCWAAYEPQIPKLTRSAVLLLDASLWGYELKANDVHRGEYCLDLVGKPFTPENCCRYLMQSPVFQKRYASLSWVVLFNIHIEAGSSNEAEEITKSEKSAKFQEELLSINILDKMQEALLEVRKKPDHLRIAAGNVKENSIHWIDLW